MDNQSKRELYQLKRDVTMIIKEITKQSQNNAEAARQQTWTIGIMMFFATVAPFVYELVFKAM